MKVNLENNFEYYNDNNTAVCNCNYCKNYCMQIKNRYPKINEYLSSINVDIQKPFELVFWEPDNEKNIRYIGCQYIVFGTCEDNFSKEIDGVVFENNLNCHPSTGITEEHFVLDFGEIVLEMNL